MSPLGGPGCFRASMAVFLAIFFLTATTVFMTGATASGAPLYAPQESVSLPRGKELQVLLKYIDRQRARVIALQRELVCRPALNPEHGGIGEEEKLRWLENRLHVLGVTDVERQDYADERVPGKVRGNLIVRLPGRPGLTGNGTTLWLLSHLDVAAPGQDGEWKGDPFSLRVEGDLIYGRGVEDNHQAIVASLLLDQALRENAITPPMNIGLLFCSGALAGFAMNIEHVMRQKPGIFGPDDLIVLMDYGSEDGGFIQVAEKVNLGFRITVTGVEGHAGLLQKTTNAFEAAAELVRELRSLGDAFPARDPFFAPPGSTFTPTLTENYSKDTHHIPGKFVFYLDARILPEYSPEAVQKALHDMAETVSAREGVTIGIEVIGQTPRAPRTSEKSPVVRALGRAITAQLGVEPRYGGIGGVSMASALRAGGFPVAVWGIQKNCYGKAEESASIKDHLNQAKVLVRMVYDQEMAPAGDNIPATGTKNTRNGTRNRQGR